jgi:hypothetical protein
MYQKARHRAVADSARTTGYPLATGAGSMIIPTLHSLADH